MMLQALCLLTLCFYTVVRSHPSGSSLTCHKENHQLYGTSLLIIDLASYTLYGYISMATFYRLASGWHSTDNLLQACHTLCD